MYTVLRNVRTEFGLRHYVLDRNGDTEQGFYSEAQADEYCVARNSGYGRHPAYSRAIRCLAYLTAHIGG